VQAELPAHRAESVDLHSVSLNLKRLKALGGVVSSPNRNVLFLPK